MKYPLLEIHWLDASSSNGWKDVDKITDKDLDHFEVKTVGYLVRENKHYWLLAQAMSSYGSVSNRFQIPKKWVKKVTRIKGHFCEYSQN